MNFICGPIESVRINVCGEELDAVVTNGCLQVECPQLSKELEVGFNENIHQGFWSDEFFIWVGIDQEGPTFYSLVLGRDAVKRLAVEWLNKQRQQILEVGARVLEHINQ